ncbi:hypothetical protein NOJ28_10020 [Neorhizobium galegae]|nr:hypothetical protein [Neorhizobium galegae]MCQ1765868.1 hypothetical protein [Neorhizobium galegae]MCQ1844782.1 hypothetical protein [Neorhizobium galegae]CDZ39513.1 Hypothetical protein NGAL_HAMBI1146_34140 [Neorhizobium galegae bv. officinalis]
MLARKLDFFPAVEQDSDGVISRDDPHYVDLQPPETRAVSGAIPIQILATVADLAVRVDIGKLSAEESFHVRPGLPHEGGGPRLQELGYMIVELQRPSCHSTSLKVEAGPIGLHRIEARGWRPVKQADLMGCALKDCAATE